MNASTLATQWLSQPATERGPADTFARELVAAHEELDSLRAKCAELQKRLNAVVHERDALAERLGGRTRPVLPQPELTVYCDVPDCSSMISIAKAPPEDAVPLWVRGRGWGYTGDGGYLCHRCKP